MKAALSLLAAAALAGAGPARTAHLEGLWRNPYGTVEVNVGHCGALLCGSVVGASASMIADARDAGYPSLLGMQLLRNFHSEGPGRWSGQVFVPETGRTYSSHIELIDSNHARVAGCLAGSFLCKSQLWQRLRP